MNAQEVPVPSQVSPLAQYMTADEAAAQAGVTSRAVRDACHRLDIGVFAFKRWLIHRDKFVAAYLRPRAGGGTNAAQ